MTLNTQTRTHVFRQWVTGIIGRSCLNNGLRYTFWQLLTPYLDRVEDRGLQIETCAKPPKPCSGVVGSVLAVLSSELGSRLKEIMVGSSLRPCLHRTRNLFRTRTIVNQ